MATTILSTQNKFTERMQELAEAMGVDLVVDHNYSNTGTFRFQGRGTFKSLLEFEFEFAPNHASFPKAQFSVGMPTDRVKAWLNVQGEKLDEFAELVEAKLEAEITAAGGEVGMTDHQKVAQIKQWIEDLDVNSGLEFDRMMRIAKLVGAK